MRLFLAIDIPQDVKSTLDKQIQDLKKQYPQFTWIPAENFHITLQFFGEHQEATKIIQRLERVLFDGQSSYLFSLSADLFINSKIVLYISFRRDKKLEELVEKIQAEFDVPAAKFVPHLTIARAKIPSKQQYFVLKKRLESMIIDIEIPVKKIYLFETIHQGKKPTYKKQAEFSLL